MRPTDTLKHEHQIIFLVLDAAQREAASIEASRKIDAAAVGRLVDFFRNFADRCYRARDEGHLFKAIERRGFLIEGGPIAVMLPEHEEGRRRIAAAASDMEKASAGDPQAVRAVRENLLAYVALLRQHIEKEDTVLYVMADRVLTEQDQDELAEAVEKVEAEEVGRGVHKKYHQLAHELSKAHDSP